MRVIDWSSDWCSSVLRLPDVGPGSRPGRQGGGEEPAVVATGRGLGGDPVRDVGDQVQRDPQPVLPEQVGQRTGSRLERDARRVERSEEHTSELQSLMRSSYAAFCFKKKKQLTPLIRLHSATILSKNTDQHPVAKT